MKSKKLKLSLIEINSFVTNKSNIKSGGPVDYSNTFTTSSTLDYHSGCTMESGCPCDTITQPCFDMH